MERARAGNRTGMSKNTAFSRLFAVIILALAAVTAIASYKSPLTRAVRDQQPIYGLIIGTDWVDYARHADTIVIARYDPAVRSLDLLSIPRDTRIKSPAINVRRVNELYAYAYKTTKNHNLASLELARNVRALLFTRALSTDSAPECLLPEIPYYLQIDYDGFKKMVDLLGGVQVTIDEPMHYDDNWGKLHIHFDPGVVMLSGQKALEYIRFRDASGDFGRVMRQQEFLINALKRFKDPMVLMRLPRIVWASIRAVKTNLNSFDHLTALWELKDLPKENIRLVQLPGRMTRDSLWTPDENAITETAHLLVSGQGIKTRRAAKNAAAETPDGKSAERVPSRAPATVEVWNASSKKGLALEVARKLRQGGFDVVKWGNYDSRQMRTFVRDHAGKTEQARAIAALLDSSRAEVFTRLEANPLVDIEVIIGEDYQKGEH